ncbi:hypothetical protein Hdeb2414_s0016g00498961 [Helianthus debilis subsp. tardiflorus]
MCVSRIIIYFLLCFFFTWCGKLLYLTFYSIRSLVVPSKRAERELLYTDECGGGGRGWISQGMMGYGRGHLTRGTCALHIARRSVDTLVDFWSALGEETLHSLLKMEEDFMEHQMYRYLDFVSNLNNLIKYWQTHPFINGKEYLNVLPKLCASSIWSFRNITGCYFEVVA